MKIATAREISAVDRCAAENCGVPTAALMERAGARVAEAAAALLGEVRGRRVLVVCGRGNNGGDGLVAARLLLEAGAQPLALLAGEAAGLRPDARAAFAAAERRGVDWLACPDDAAFASVEERARRADLVIDALLGIGFAPPARGVAATAIRFVNALGRPVLAVDLPSGLSADTGRVEGEAVRATGTVTLGYPKLCLLVHPAAGHVGRLWCGDIGLPRETDALVAGHLNLVTPADLAPHLAPRDPRGHKGTYGHLLLVAGSRGLVGAAVLAARGALRAGAGLATVALPATVAPPVLEGLPEAMTLPLPDDGAGAAGRGAAEAVLARLAGVRALVVGPGISSAPGAAELVGRLAAEVGLPLVLDADGLNALAGLPAPPAWRSAAVVLTPHPGELARLLAATTADVEGRRLEAAREAAERYRAIVVLKGARSVVAAPGGTAWINATGNPAMATAGMGDVLTGAIAAQLARGIPALEAAVLGVHLHGLAGDLAAAAIGPWGLLASDVADRIPEASRRVAADHERRTDRTLSLLVA